MLTRDIEKVVAVVDFIFATIRFKYFVKTLHYRKIFESEQNDVVGIGPAFL